MEVEHTAELEKKQLEHQRAMDEARSEWEKGLEELEGQHQAEMQQRAEETRSLAAAFESQAGRLNAMLKGKEDEIAASEARHSELQEKLHTLTVEHTESLLHLTHEKEALQEECRTLAGEAATLSEQVAQMETTSAETLASI